MRLRQMLITPEVLMFIDRGTFHVERDGLPKDARLVQTTFDPMTGFIQLFVESLDFDEVRIGDIPPIHPAPVFTRVDD